MIIAEVVKFHQELLKNLHKMGVRMEDAEYVNLFSDYCRLRRKGEKVSYIVAKLSEQYAKVSEKYIALSSVFEVTAIYLQYDLCQLLFLLVGYGELCSVKFVRQ